MNQEIKLSGGLSITLDENQKKELLEQLTNAKDVKELIKQEILDMLEQNKSNVSFLNSDESKSKYPTSRFEILNNKGEWLFDIDYDKKNPHFWYSYYRIYKFFTKKYSINYDVIQEVIKSILVGYLNLKDVTVYVPFARDEYDWLGI
jgi:hypothetical protein